MCMCVCVVCVVWYVCGVCVSGLGVPVLVTLFLTGNTPIAICHNVTIN